MRQPEKTEIVVAHRDLRTLVERACPADAIRKADLRLGDRVIVTTRNSVYTIWALGDGHYSVRGGWFDRKGESPATTTINGCTWGGRAIHTGLVAASGLFLEFGNEVLTTRIQSVRLVRAADQPASLN